MLFIIVRTLIPMSAVAENPRRVCMRGATDFNVDLKKSYTVGDSIRDYLLGFNMSGKRVFLFLRDAAENSRRT
ncbi:hypothetical protein AGMMS5026_00860 [Endomicrobiia bacterium]|nr:hypothetical protein AGMMS49523_05900 [Endomicrobiia bacterium]GHT11643.1 hypothetical protein AGMMS49571_02280 [Endomicrobiia bacterium]GHT20495.1 hypothetical protein AGMMS49929_07260 [Endomicrobiia bacterium]GHT26760.1 hypothetical protein AGMMS49995_04150 [Endomicrobiia bacterium]GHT29486.1 hypothetical protein AGMMS5026_00860 [Endomicrobiia bacterium]